MAYYKRTLTTKTHSLPNKLLYAAFIATIGLIGLAVYVNATADQQPVKTKPIADTAPSTPAPKDCGSIQCDALSTDYDNLKSTYQLMYSSAQDALAAFRDGTSSFMGVQRISTYVPGKLPHEDGSPYFIGRGIVNEKENTCIVGYMNLVTGIVESHSDVCIIKN
jgi:hypothetical protein